MKLTGKVSMLREMVGRAAAVVDSKCTNETLRAIRIEAEGSVVSVYGTDMVTGVLVTSDSDITVEEEGIACLPAAELVSALRSNSGDCSLETNETKAKLICGSRYNLSMIDVADYPDPMVVPLATDMHDSPNIGKLLHNVSFASAKEATKFMLNGVWIDFEKDKTTAVASNGIILASSWTKKIAVDETDGSSDKVNLILPPTWCSLVERWAGETTRTQISIPPGVLVVANMPEDNMQTTVFGKLLDGKYPEWEAVFGNEYPVQVTFKTEDFKQALARILFIGDDFTDPAVTLVLLHNTVTLSTNDMAGQDAKASFDVELKQANDEQFTVSFCPSFVSAMFSATGFDEMNMSICDVHTPLLFTRKKYYRFIVAQRKVSSDGKE